MKVLNVSISGAARLMYSVLAIIQRNKEGSVVFLNFYMYVTFDNSNHVFADVPIFQGTLHFLYFD